MSDRRATKADYGIDAPGIRRAMASLGLAGFGIGVSAAAIVDHLGGAGVSAIWWAGNIALLVGLYGSGMACYMTYASRVGKLRTCARLLDQAALIRPWSGAEQVLDVGCGRGLMLVEAAKRLTTGSATGIDIWRSIDQGDNTPEAALRNARIEGVADRVSVQTGDALNLPFPARSFDVVLSHWVFHNLPSAADRKRALAEVIRVLKPGGLVVIADIQHYEMYSSTLLKDGMIERYADAGGWRTAFVGVLTGGSFRPAELIAQAIR